MKVTVVIPCYNHKDYVAQAINSVLEQSYGDVELIVIDDGSKDGSKDVITTLHQTTTKPFIFIDRENRGLVRTLQQGLELAKGEYFCELASDDYFHPDNIKKRVAYLDAHREAAVVFTDGYKINSAGITFDRITRDKIKEMYICPDPIYFILDNNITPVFSTGLMRTQALQDAGGFDSDTFRFYEDLDTPVRLSLHGGYGYIDECLFFRREHGTNVSGTTTHVRREKVLFYTKMLSYPGLEKYQSIAQQRLKRSIIKLGRSLLLALDIEDQDKKVFLEGANRYPRDLKISWYKMRVNRKIQTDS